MYTLQHSSTGLESSLLSKKFILFPVTIVLYPLAFRKLFIFFYILYVKNRDKSNRQHIVLDVSKYEYGSYMNSALDLNVKYTNTSICKAKINYFYLKTKSEHKKMFFFFLLAIIVSLQRIKFFLTRYLFCEKLFYYILHDVRLNKIEYNHPLGIPSILKHIYRSHSITALITSVRRKYKVNYLRIKGTYYLNIDYNYAPIWSMITVPVFPFFCRELNDASYKMHTYCKKFLAMITMVFYISDSFRFEPIIMSDNEIMDYEEEMAPASPFGETEEYEKDFPVFSDRHGKQVGQGFMDDSLLDMDEHDVFVPRVDSVNDGEGEAETVEGDVIPPNIPSLSVEEVAPTPSNFQPKELVKGAGSGEANVLVYKEREAFSEVTPNETTSAESVLPKHAMPYLTIRHILEKVKLVRSAIIHKIPSKSVPLVPDSYPKSTLVNCNDGKKAISFRVPARNPKQPPFYPSNVKDLGGTVGLPNFFCKSGYTITFDTKRKCRICSFEHDIFPKDNVGVLLLGDAYTPPIVGANGKCIPVFRMENPSFTQIGDKIKFLLRARVDHDGQSLARPNIIIISIPSYLSTVGPTKYVEELIGFQRWIQNYISYGKDFETRNTKIVLPYNGNVEVYEGFSLFAAGDYGLSESYAIINRSLEIHSAQNPNTNIGILYNSFKEIMTEINQDPPVTAPISYVNISPAEPDFTVYEEGELHLGVPVDNLETDGSISAAILNGFLSKTVKQIRTRYAKLGFEHTLPPISFFDPVTPAEFENLAMLENFYPDSGEKSPRVFIIGHSNMRRLSGELKRIIVGEVIFVKYTPNLNSTKEEINSFFDELNLHKNDIVCFSGFSNYILQGTTHVRYQGVKPTGAPAQHVTEQLSRGTVHHQIGVAPYNASFMDRIVKHNKLIMEDRFDNKTARFVLIPPLPRYLEKCCATQGHFDTHFNGGDLCAEIIRLGVYLSRLPCNRYTVCILPEDICPRDYWGIRGEMLAGDRVHLTDKGFKILSGITHRGILCVTNPPLASELAVDPEILIPASLSFSEWVVLFRETCGYDTILPTSCKKRPNVFSGAKPNAKKR